MSEILRAHLSIPKDVYEELYKHVVDREKHKAAILVRLADIGLRSLMVGASEMREPRVVAYEKKDDSEEGDSGNWGALSEEASSIGL